MRCRCCESKRTVYLAQYNDNADGTLISKEYICLDCNKRFFVSGIKVVSCEKIEETDINYLCGCMGINNHTIYNDAGEGIKIEL